MALLLKMLTNLRRLLGATELEGVHILDIPAVASDPTMEEETMSALAIANIHLVGLLNARLDVITIAISDEKTPGMNLMRH